MPETATPLDDGTVPDTGKPGEAQDQSAALSKALSEMGIQVQIKDVRHGPRLTRYRVLLMNLADSGKIDRGLPQLALALNLGDKLPAKANADEARTVFIDLPRPRETWSNVPFDKVKDWAAKAPRDTSKLLIYAGVTVTGEDVVIDLATAPHLFVGGTTGSGKSVCLHSLIASLLLKHTPDTLQLALIDPKRVEFARYAKLPNLYRGSIATETPQAREMLQELVVEMDARYASFERVGVSNIADARKLGQQLPFIVAVVEEMSALVHGDKNIQPLIERLAEKARAAGIHLVLATQRPDADTFTGLLRSNIPARIALSVQKGTESKIILDEIGAENLLGSGDMLLKLPGESLKRAHGVFLKPEQVVAAIKIKACQVTAAGLAALPAESTVKGRTAATPTLRLLWETAGTALPCVGRHLRSGRAVVLKQDRREFVAEFFLRALTKAHGLIDKLWGVKLVVDGGPPTHQSQGERGRCLGHPVISQKSNHVVLDACHERDLMLPSIAVFRAPEFDFGVGRGERRFTPKLREQLVRGNVHEAPGAA